VRVCLCVCVCVCVCVCSISGTGVGKTREGGRETSARVPVVFRAVSLFFAKNVAQFTEYYEAERRRAALS